MNTFLLRYLPWRLCRFLWLRQTTRNINRTLANPDAPKVTTPDQPTVGYHMWQYNLARKAVTQAEFHAALSKTPLEYAPVWDATQQKIDQLQHRRGYRYWNYQPGQEEKG